MRIINYEDIVVVVVAAVIVVIVMIVVIVVVVVVVNLKSVKLAISRRETRSSSSE